MGPGAPAWPRRMFEEQPRALRSRPPWTSENARCPCTERRENKLVSRASRGRSATTAPGNASLRSASDGQPVRSDSGVDGRAAQQLLLRDSATPVVGESEQRLGAAHVCGSSNGKHDEGRAPTEGLGAPGLDERVSKLGGHGDVSFTLEVDVAQLFLAKVEVRSIDFGLVPQEQVCPRVDLGPCGHNSGYRFGVLGQRWRWRKSAFFVEFHMFGTEGRPNVHLSGVFSHGAFVQRAASSERQLPLPRHGPGTRRRRFLRREEKVASVMPEVPGFRSAWIERLGRSDASGVAH